MGLLSSSFVLNSNELSHSVISCAIEFYSGIKLFILPMLSYPATYGLLNGYMELIYMVVKRRHCYVNVASSCNFAVQSIQEHLDVNVRIQMCN